MPEFEIWALPEYDYLFPLRQPPREIKEQEMFIAYFKVRRLFSTFGMNLLLHFVYSFLLKLKQKLPSLVIYCRTLFVLILFGENYETVCVCVCGWVGVCELESCLLSSFSIRIILGD